MVGVCTPENSRLLLNTGTSIGPGKKKYDQIDKKPVFILKVSKKKPQKI
jgi:hypothetical protein